MSVDPWLPGASVVDLSESHGYGPFQQPFLGVIVHVNQSNGNLANFFRNSSDVCPNFQVYKTGAIEQYLPINNQPWCQTAGNQQYAAIETEGYTNEPWTAAQLNSVARIVGFYREQMNLSMVLAEAPGQNGIGWHGMGGAAWGNHPGCPGDLRKAQRQDAIDIVTGIAPSGGGTPIGDDDMTPDEHQMLVNCQNALGAIEAQYLGPTSNGGPNTAYRVDLIGDAVNALQASVNLIPGEVLAGLPAASGGNLQPLLDAINALPAETVAAIKEAL